MNYTSLISESSWPLQIHLETKNFPEKTLVLIVLSLLLVFSMVIKVAAKKCLVKRKSRWIRQSGDKKNRWDKLPRISLLKAIWLYRNKNYILQSARRLAVEYGTLIRITVLNEEYVVLNSPDFAEKLLSSRTLGHIVKPPQLYEPIFDMIGGGVITSKGDVWHSKRKILSKAFTNTALKRYTRIFNKCAKRLVSQLDDTFRKDENNCYHQINTAIQTGGIEIIAETVLGLDITQNEKDAEIMFTSVNSWKEIAFQRFSSGWLVVPLFWKLSSLSREYYRSISDIEDVIKRMIKRYQDERLRQGDSNIESNDNDSFDNMMELMITSGLSQSEILNEVKTMIMAGYETVSATVHFLLFMLASNQTHQIACREEVDRIFDDPAKYVNGGLTMEAVSELKYLEQCLLETMRIFPTAYITARKLEAPLKIDNDLEIPSGTNVIVPNILLHMSPQLFPQPDEFQPDRFLPENCRNSRAYTFLPFSAGPRGCIGMKFALLEAKTIVAHILREFEIYTNDKIGDVPIIPSVLLRPERDFYFRLQKRNVNHLV